MDPVRDAAASAGTPAGGLSRLLARAALPPVSVPSAYAGDTRAVVRPAPLDLPNDGMQPAPRPAHGAVAGRVPTAAVSGPGDEALLADDSSHVPGTVTPLRAPSAAGTGPPRDGIARAAYEHGHLAASRPAAPSPAAPAGADAARPEAAATMPAQVDPLPGETPPPVAVPQDPAPVPVAEEPIPVVIEKPVAIEPSAMAATPTRPPTPAGPDRTDARAPTPSAPPVVIGRIEVHVDSPAAHADPFAGCRVVAAGLTARRGGGW